MGEGEGQQRERIAQCSTCMQVNPSRTLLQTLLLKMERLAPEQAEGGSLGFNDSMCNSVS